MDHDHETGELSLALDRIGRAELVVGVVSCNSAHAIGRVIEAIVTGLAAAYPDARCAIVNADGGSRDGTPELARRAAADRYPVVTVSCSAPPLRRPATSLAGLPGRGGALRALLEVAGRLEAWACVLVDGDVPTIAPDWVRLLADPVLRDSMDFVAPLYAGHKYDGMLTSSLIYPLTRALYGRRVRQPVGGHFGLSGGLARRLARSGVWERPTVPDLDVWMTTTAIADGHRVCQAQLGAGRHGSRGAAAELGASFTQVVGSVFALMEELRPAWWAVVASDDVPTFGQLRPPGLEPASVNVDRMISTFRQGVADLMSVWRRALRPDTCAALVALEEAADFIFPPELWARSVYDCAVAYHCRSLPRRHLLRAMIPLYLGRAAAFVMRTASCGAAEVEAEIEGLCGSFESLKPHLLDRWDAPRP